MVKEKTIEKVVDTLEEKVIEKVTATQNRVSDITDKSSETFKFIDYNRNYKKSNIYADINYRDNFKGDRELLARAGFIYYLK